MSARDGVGIAWCSFVEGLSETLWIEGFCNWYVNYMNDMNTK